MIFRNLKLEGDVQNDGRERRFYRRCPPRRVDRQHRDPVAAVLSREECRADHITRTEIENALMEEALVNYFEIGSCLDDITQQKLVTLTDGRYTITEKGRKVAQELAYDLPRSVRERAVAAVLRSQTWARKEAQYAARITEKPDGHCSIRCTIKALDQELFCLNIGTPDRLSADLVKKQFILKGNEIYQMLITKLTEETN